MRYAEEMALFFKASITNGLKYITKVGTIRQASLLCNIQSQFRRGLCKNKVLCSTSKRSFRLFHKPSAEKYKQMDEIPEHYTLIYKNGMQRYIVAAHTVTFATALIVTVTLLLTSQKDIIKMEMNFDDWKEKTRGTENEVIVYITCATLLAVVVHSLVLKLPLRIYKAPKQAKYVVMMNSAIPSTRKKLTCQAGSVKFIGKESIVPWKDSLYRINNDRVVILLDNFFQRPADLYIMLGEQKDPDLSDDKTF